MYKIYLIESPTSNFKYIGKTNNIKQRWSKHKSDSEIRPTTFLHNWLKKYKDAYITEIDSFINEIECLYFESWYIDLFKSWGINLMNLTNGGEGISGYKHTEKTKNIISNIHKNLKYSEETKIKMSNIKKGEKHFNFGKQLTNEHKINLSNSKVVNNTPIIAYDLEGNEIGIYNNASEVKRILDTGNDCIINIEFMENTNDKANLKDIKNGVYDKQLIQFLNSSKRDGRHFQIRTLHEMNGNWYPWAIYRENNTIQDFIGAWYHVTDIIRESGANVSIQLNYNQISYDDKYSFRQMYPGDKNVDMIVITSYNRAGTDKHHKQWKSFNDNFYTPYNEICQFSMKPIGIAEISSTSYNGWKPFWIIQTAQTIKKDYPRIKQMTWFLNNKEVNNILWDWDMNTTFDKFSFIIANNIILKP